MERCCPLAVYNDHWVYPPMGLARKASSHPKSGWEITQAPLFQSAQGLIVAASLGKDEPSHPRPVKEWAFCRLRPQKL